jgi:hypothetical protein
VWVVFMAQPRKAICVSIMINELDVHIPQYEMGAFPIVEFPLVLIMESFNISAYGPRRSHISSLICVFGIIVHF